MEYDARLVRRLLEKGEILDVNGVAVECKATPDVPPHSVDSRQLKLRKGSGPLPETLKERRDCMGGFNYNLCRQEIWTQYIEVPTSRGMVPVWGYYPRRGRTKRPGLIYVHGGAFLGGSPFAVENPCRLISDRGDAIVWNVDYSLAPENPYPIPCTQVYEVVFYLHEHAEEFGMDADKIVIAGDSAGGNLCAAASLIDRDNGTHFIKAQALLYAKLTFTNQELPGYERDESAFEIIPEQAHLLPDMLRIGSDQSNAGDEAVYVQGKYDIKTPYISPAFGDCTGLPKTLFALAEYDGLRLEGEFYAKKLQDAGVPVRVLRYCGICHGFLDNLGILPQAEAVATEIANLLNEI